MPGACQKTRSAPQKQPIPTITCSVSSGNGRLERGAEHEVGVRDVEGAGVAAGQGVGRLGHVGLVPEEEAHDIKTSYGFKPWPP